MRDAGLPAVFVLMVAESACIPIPSEATMLFAGFAVADPGQSSAHHHLTLLGIVARRRARQPRRLVDRLRRRARRAPGADRTPRPPASHMEPSHIEWADRWFERYGEPAVLFSRMMPIVRTFISLPAGVARMPFGRFTLLTPRLASPGCVGAGASPAKRSAATGKACAKASSTSTTQCLPVLAGDRLARAAPPRRAKAAAETS